MLRGHLPHLVLPTAGLPEVSHRRQLGVNGQSVVPPVVEGRHRLLCTLLVLELGTRLLSQRQIYVRAIAIFVAVVATYLDVDVAHQVVPQVVTHVHLLDRSILHTHTHPQQ